MKQERLIHVPKASVRRRHGERGVTGLTLNTWSVVCPLFDVCVFSPSRYITNYHYGISVIRYFVDRKRLIETSSRPIKYLSVNKRKSLEKNVI